MAIVRLESPPHAKSVGTRAMGTLHDSERGPTLACAALNGELDPLTDLDVRLFMGMSPQAANDKYSTTSARGRPIRFRQKAREIISDLPGHAPSLWHRLDPSQTEARDV